MKAVFKWNRGALSKRDKQFEKAQNYVDEECLKLATYFHGFIYRDEAKIKQWMLEQKKAE